VSAGVLEQDALYSVAPDFRLPELLSACEGAERMDERERSLLQSTYYDTAGLVLMSHGIALRYRESDQDSSWSLAMGDGSERTDVGPAGRGGGLPPAMRAAVHEHVAAEPLVPLISVVLTRRTHAICASDGRELALLHDDIVQAEDLRTAAVLFMRRTLQVSPGEDPDARTIPAITECLVAAGAICTTTSTTTTTDSTSAARTGEV
jgi:hypothetical protein